MTVTSIGTSFADAGQGPSPDPYSQPVGSLSASSNANVVLTADTSQYQSQMAAAAKSTLAVGDAVSNLFDKVDQLFKFSGKALKLVGAGDLALLTSGAASAAALQKELSPLAATAAVTGQKFGTFQSAVENAFDKFPVARGQVAALVRELANLGVAQRDISSLTQTFVKLQGATGEQNLAGPLVQLSRQFGGTNAQSVERYANSLLTLSKNAGVSAGGVLDFSNAIAPIAKQAGIGQTAVMGVSTAFQKAGASGYAAANIFNSMVNDITTLTKTGSPELVKYASLVGMTADQFRKLPATNQISQVFSALSRGGPRAINFADAQGYGIRGLSALQAVANVGGLQQYINQATGASGDTKNLDNGAKAAFGGLTDAAANVRNQLEQLATTVGRPLLGMFTGLTHGLGFVLRGINDFAGHLGPAATALTALVGVLGPVAGFMLAHATMIAGGAAVRSLVNNGPRQAFTDARLVKGGMPLAETATGAALGTEQAAWLLRTRVAYSLGGMFPGKSSPGLMRDLGPGAMNRLSGIGITGVMALPNWIYGGQARGNMDSMKAPYARSAYNEASAAAKGQVAALKASAAELWANTTTFGALRQSTWKLTKNVLAAGASTVPAGFSLLGSGLKKFGGDAGSLLARGFGGLFSMPGLIATSVGLPLLFGGIDKLKSHAAAGGPNAIDASLNPIQKYSDALGVATSNLANFSTAVNSAADSAKAGSGSTATSFAEAKNISGAEAAKYGNTGSTDQTINALSKYAKHNVPAAIALMQSYGIGGDPRNLDLFGQNLLGAGWTRSEVTQVLAAYRPGQVGFNANHLATAILGTEGRTGILGHVYGGGANASGTGATLTGSALTGLQDQRYNDLDTHSTRFAQTRYLRNTLDLFSALAHGADKGKSAQDSMLTASLAELANIPQERAAADLGSITDRTTQQARHQTPAQERQMVYTALRRSGFLRTIRESGGATQYGALDQVLDQTRNQPSDSLAAQVKGFGALGRFFMSDKTIGKAIGGQSGDPATVQKAAENLATAADKASGSYGRAAASLNRLAGKLGDPASSAVASKAAAISEQRLGYQLPYMSQAQQVKALGVEYQAAQVAANKPGASQQQVDHAADLQGQFEQAKAGLNQTLISKLQMAKQYITDTERSNQDYQLSVARSEQDFYTSQQRAEQDYQTQRYRTVRDFNIQMAQSQQDYNISVARSNRDFRINELRAQQDYGLQVARAQQDFRIQQQRTLQQSEQTVYDPYSPINPSDVISAGSLIGNLQQQNQALKLQRQELQALKKAGLTQHAIDTLQLADPKNAQQLDQMYQQLIRDPKLITEINRQVAQRQADTKALTQSSLNEEFRNTTQDFQRGMDRMAEDFHTQQQRAQQDQAKTLSDMQADYRLQTQRAEDAERRALDDMANDFERSEERAAEDQQKSLNRMAQDHKTMLRRAAADLKTAMTEIYGDFVDGYGKTLLKMNDKLKQFAPAVSRLLVNEVNQMLQAAGAAPLSPTAGGAGVPQGTGAGMAPPGSYSNPYTTSGTVGLNSKGQLGYYGPHGNWHPATPAQKRQAQNEPGGPPHVAPPGYDSSDTPASAQRYASLNMGRYGWKQSQMDWLLPLWTRESGWSHTADTRQTGLDPPNASTFAYGIAQARNYNKMPKAAWPYDKGGNADGQLQVNWGLNYIRGRYGSPEKAWEHEQSHGWYAKGAILSGPQVIGVGEKGPEMVLPLDDRGQRFVAGMYEGITRHIVQSVNLAPGIAGRAEPASATYHQDYSTKFLGDITVVAQDTKKMEAELAQKARLARLTNPQAAVS